MTHAERVGSDIAPHYPCKITLHIYVTNGVQSGEIEYALPHGLHPTERVIRAAMKEAVDRVQEMNPGREWRLCNRHEFVQSIIREVYGQTVAIPGPKRFKSHLTVSDLLGTTPADKVWDGDEPESQPAASGDIGEPQGGNEEGA